MIQDRMYSITLQKLRIFAAVAKERSFVKAADAVYLSSPTVSEGIKSLENVVGLKLINRSRGNRHVELTEAGQILLESYDEISHLLAKAAKALDAVKGLERGTVAFGADVTFGGYLLPLVHHTFCRDHPSISVRVEIDKRRRILEGLRQGQLDIAVLFGPNEQAGLVQEPLIPCYMVPIGPPGHRLAGTKPAPFSELARDRLVLPGRSSPLRRALDQMAADAGTTLDIALETGNFNTILQAVLDGFGVTVLSAHYLADEIATGRLCLLQVDGFPLKMEWFVIHSNIRLTPSAQALKAHLLESRSLLQNKSHLSVMEVK